MILFQLKTEEEMRAAHAAARPRRLRQRDVAPPPLNTDVVLDLGSKVSFQFRGRTYWVPPLSWHAGERLMVLWNEASRFEGALTRATAPGYFAAIRQMPALLWRNCYPAGRWRRLRARLGLMRNPLRQATEQELIELTNFFLGRRMKSSVGFPTTAPGRRRPQTA